MLSMVRHCGNDGINHVWVSTSLFRLSLSRQTVEQAWHHQHRVPRQVSLDKLFLRRKTKKKTKHHVKRDMAALHCPDLSPPSPALIGFQLPALAS